MAGLLFKRFLDGLITLLIVVAMTFALMRLLPGGPFDRERVLAPEVQQNLEAQYHLHDPLPVQFMAYLGNLVQGDLGPSYQFKTRKVQTIVAEASGPSFALGAVALLLGLSLGLVLGTIAGVTPWPWLDKTLLLVGVTGLSCPAFLFGGALVLVFSLGLGWLPTATLPPLWESPRHWVLPTITLAIVPFA